ncbi:MAG: carboxypeptidase-like regulatory domain-containing protein [Bacteroidota bacterium]
MKRGFYLLFLLSFGIALTTHGQSAYSGNILDASDRQFLEGVSVSVIGRESRDTTNQRGYFSVKAFQGDTLLVEFEGFISRKISLEKDRFLMIEIQDNARFLPTFEVKSPGYSYRFKDGRLVLREEDEEVKPSRKGEVIAAPLSNADGTGGIAISGVISYFTKKARYAREYEKKKEWHQRRSGYYAIVQSDSIRTELKRKFELDSANWDELIIRFNQFHAAHEFLDWPESRVLNQLKEFLRIETSFLD